MITTKKILSSWELAFLSLVGVLKPRLCIPKKSLQNIQKLREYYTTLKCFAYIVLQTKSLVWNLNSNITSKIPHFSPSQVMDKWLYTVAKSLVM